jgi:hypothetical protein
MIFLFRYYENETKSLALMEAASPTGAHLQRVPILFRAQS